MTPRKRTQQLSPVVFNKIADSAVLLCVVFSCLFIGVRNANFAENSLSVILSTVAGGVIGATVPNGRTTPTSTTTTTRNKRTDDTTLGD